MDESEENPNDLEEQFENNMKQNVLPRTPSSSQSKLRRPEIKWENKHLIWNENQLSFSGNENVSRFSHETKVFSINF